MLPHATLIHHPHGGSARDDELARVRELLAPHFTLTIELASPERGPALLAREALARGCHLLIASGGDGTVSAVAGELVGHPEGVLGILPRGTANSIAGHLGIDSALEAACAVIVGGHVRTIDTARVNSCPMVLLATIGLHAEAVIEADPELKRKVGPLAYVLEEVERMREGALFEVTLEANGQRETFEANGVTIANLAPPTTLLAQGPGEIIEDDGMLDVTLVAIRGFADALATSLHLATHAFRQQPAERDNIGFFRTAEIRVATREPRRVMVDGEDAMETPIVVRCIPHSLRVLTPAPAQP